MESAVVDQATCECEGKEAELCSSWPDVRPGYCRLWPDAADDVADPKAIQRRIFLREVGLQDEELSGIQPTKRFKGCGAFVEDQAVVARMGGACRSLWVSVLHRALKDAAGVVAFDGDEVDLVLGCKRGETNGLRFADRAIAMDFFRLFIADEAAEWFESDDDSEGSFLWICSWLDINSERVRVVVRCMRQDDFVCRMVVRSLGRHSKKRDG